MILSGLCLGLWKADELRRREAALLDWKRMLQALRTGVSFSARPLEELVLGDRDNPFCRLAAEEPGFSRDPGAALERAGERLLREPADLDLYRGFARGLGESGAQGQLEHLALYASLLEANLGEAREAKEKRSRLYVCLGLFGAAALCLVLL